MEEEDKSNNYLEIVWTNKPLEKVNADSVVAYDLNPSIFIAFKDGSEVPVGFFNMNFIQSIKVVSDE